MLVKCKRCGSEKVVKSGKINKKQRFKCNDCFYHFVEGDARTNEELIKKRRACVALYILGKTSMRELARRFNTYPSLVCKWITKDKNQSLVNANSSYSED